MRSLIAVLLVSLAASACGWHHYSEPSRSVTPVSRSEVVVAEVAITVSNLSQSTNFFLYQLEATLIGSALVEDASFARLSGIASAAARVNWLTIGGQRIALRQFVGVRGRTVRPEAASNDLDFQHLALVVADMERAYRQVGEAPVRAVSISGPQTIPESNTAAAGIRAFYFRDTDGHPLELIWYPHGKGLARWQERGESLFLGIDHTAIAVSDTERSLRFYEALGLEVAGQSLNAGIEQAHLSGVPGARVRITGLRGQEGLGVEFLEYLSPGPGESPEPKTIASDIGFYETSILVADFNETLERVQALGVEFISTGAGRCGQSCLEGRRAVVVRDPDGHAVRIVEASRTQ